MPEIPPLTAAMKSKAKVSIECIETKARIAEASDAPSSCGLDFWLSPTALRWTSSYLNAIPANIRVTAEGQHASISCLLRRLPWGFTLASAYPYGRIAGDESLFKSSINEISNALFRHGILRLELPFTGPHLAQWRAYPQDHPRLLRTHSLDAVRHVLDLRPSDPSPLEGRFDPNIRWSIRKAERSRCTVRHACMDDVELLQSLYVDTMRAKGAPVNYGPARWEGILSEIETQRQGSVYIGEIHGQASGMAAVVDGAISRHLIQLAVPPNAHSSRLGELLVMTAMREARASGKQFFDFMASSKTDTGLIAYKAKWGADCEPINHVVIKGIPGMQHLIDVARWLNRTGARLHGA